jgi:nitrous oxidase accessory protein NosD
LDFLLSDNVNVYHNNIYDESALFVESQVACDNGYPSGGNLWFGYSGSDSNGDKIGDTPYAPDLNVPTIEDRYPLMTAFPCIHDLELESLGADTPVFNRGRIVNVELGIKNTGHFNEIFNATIYSN